MPGLLLIALAACTQPPPVVIDGEVTGTWHGQRWQSNARVLWLSRYAADGAIEIEFLTCYSGKRLRHERQLGHESLVDGVLTTTIERIHYDNEPEWIANVTDGDADGEPDPPFEHQYRLLALDGEHMAYQSIELGTVYEADRVAEDFELTCPPPRKLINTQPGERTGTDAWVRRGVGAETEPEGEAPPLEDVLSGELPTED